MRIGFYHDGAGTRHAGGIAIYTRRMAAELARTHDVTVCTAEGTGARSLADLGVDVVTTPAFDDTRSSAAARLLPAGPQDVSKLRMTVWAARNGVFDYLESTVDLLFSFQVLDDLLLSNLVDVPTVRGFHSDFTTGIGTAIRERWTTTQYHVANSPYLADRVADEFGYEVDDVIPPGVDTDRFHPDAEPAFESATPTILYVGRLTESKGILDLVDATARLEAPVHLRIVGDGDEAAVRRRIRRHDLGSAVTLEGEVPHEALPGYYVAADVFCLPTHAESFGMVNLEAMAAGTPVVTTNLDGIETYLRPDIDGLVVDPGAVDALANAIDQLLTDPDRRQTLGRQGRRRALEFTWERQAEQLAQFCERLVAPACDEPRTLVRSDESTGR